MVGGDYIQRNMSAAAIWGRIVNIAYQSGMQANVNFAPMLMKRLSLLATTLRARSAAGERRDPRRAAARSLAADRARQDQAGRRPRLSLADAQAAHARMAKSDHIGKLLLTP